MRVAFFSTKSYDEKAFNKANEHFGHELTYHESRLRLKNVALAEGFPAVCAFVNDVIDAPCLEKIAKGGTRLIAMRCAGYNNVDLDVAKALGLTVVRVPGYSPYAVAEHTLSLILGLNRKIHKSYNRTREGNFSLEGLEGFDLYGKTVGIIGTGKIGAITARILSGFGCRLLFHDAYSQDPGCEAMGEYVELSRLYAEADIISLHCPLTSETHHLINAAAIRQMKPGVMLINTSRGGIVDTRAVIDGLKSKHIGYFGLDVYEGEASLFFEDRSGRIIQDDVFSRLVTFPNVLMTGHQAFFTQEALANIADTTLTNIRQFEKGEPCPNIVLPGK